VDESGPIFRNSSGGHDYVLYGQHDDAPDTFAPFDDAIRDADGWKLIQGTGGRPSSWSQPVNVTDSDLTEGQAQQACTTPNCAVDRLFNPMGLPSVAMKLPSPRDVSCSSNSSWQRLCYPNNDLSHSAVGSPADCCTACSKAQGCVGWTYNPRNTAANCYLKRKMGPPGAGQGCLSGGAPPTPPTPKPPKAPTPAPAPTNGTLLFNVLADPGEHTVSYHVAPLCVCTLTGPVLPVPALFARILLFNRTSPRTTLTSWRGWPRS
jgi:hypothetical protein